MTWLLWPLVCLILLVLWAGFDWSFDLIEKARADTDSSAEAQPSAKGKVT